MGFTSLAKPFSARPAMHCKNRLVVDVLLKPVSLENCMPETSTPRVTPQGLRIEVLKLDQRWATTRYLMPPRHGGSRLKALLRIADYVNWRLRVWCLARLEHLFKNIVH